MKINRTLLILSSMILLASCGNGQASSSTSQAQSHEQEVTIVDGIGRSVTVTPSKLKKVVCVGAGALRLYSYIGDMKLLSGVEDIDNPDKTTMWKDVARPYYMANMDLLKTLPSCGKGGPKFQSPEKEAILECNPDVIISEYEDVKVADDLSNETGVPVITMKMGSKGCFDETLRNTFTTLGKAFGREDRAKTINDYIINIEKDISDRTKDIADEDKPSVYLAGLGNWGAKGLFDTASQYAPFTVAHISNIVDGKVAKPGQQAIEKELFESLGETMDKMILDASGLANIKTYFAEHQDVFDNVKAVQDGEVYLQMAYNAYYTNIELALMDAYYDASVVYPEAFKDVDLTAKYNEITKTFNGKELYNEIKAMGSSYGGFQKIDNLKEFLAQ